MDLKLTVDGLEKERDFYFSKLRDIELICQEHENENSPIITGIVSVLYATEVRAGHLGTPLEPRGLPWAGRVSLPRQLPRPCSLRGVPGGVWALPKPLRQAWWRLVCPPVPPLCRQLPRFPAGGLCPTRGRRAGGAAARGPRRVLAPARARAPRAAPTIDIGGPSPRLAPHRHTPSRPPAAPGGRRHLHNQPTSPGEERGCAGGRGWAGLWRRAGAWPAPPPPHIYFCCPPV